MPLHRSALVWTCVLVVLGCSETTAPASTGSLTVSVASSGASLDKDGYRLRVDGDSGRVLANSGQVRIPRLSAGSHQVELSGLAINCTVTGGNSRTITIEREAEATAAFVVTCPLALDGHLVFYRAETLGHGYWGEIYVSLPDGSGEVNLTEEDGMVNNITPAVSPDATLIAYVSNAVVTVMAPDGSGKRPLSTPSAEEVYASRWSRDGRRILMSVHDLSQGWDAYVTSLDGSAFVPLTAEGFQDATAIDWSPDGSEALITASLGDTTGYDLVVARTDGSGWRYLTHTTDTDIASGWSPDGQRILFMRQGGPPAYSRTLFSIHPDGTGLAPLTVDSLYPNGDAAWSPDGARVAFEASGTGPQGIYMMNADGSGLAPVTPGGGQYVSWTRDGSRISFRRFVVGNGDTYDIFAVNPDGSNLQNLTQSMDQEINFDWAPIR